MSTPRVIFASRPGITAENGPNSTPQTRPTSPPLIRTDSTMSLENGRRRSSSHHYETARPDLLQPTETTRLLNVSSQDQNKRYTDVLYESPESIRLSRRGSHTSLKTYRTHLRKHTARKETVNPDFFVRSGLRTPRLHRSLLIDESTTIDDRAWYDQFTSTDWVHDSIADGYRAWEIRKEHGLRGRLRLLYDAAQGWILVAIIGFLTAAVAYVIDITEAAVFDLKKGYCTTAWFRSESKCCHGHSSCESWRTWSQIISPSSSDHTTINYIGFILGCVLFAMISCFLTMLSKTVIPSTIASTFDENLGAETRKASDLLLNENADLKKIQIEVRPAMTYYSAAGSGVAEVKVILSGFVLHGYLGLKTLAIKCVALIFSVASGMSLGKEGPYVHIATCIGNIACRLFPKYNLNDGKRREVMSAAAASGVAVAFGSPLGGVLFSLEEVSYYFPPKTLFRTFFCCIFAALWLKFFDPYGTGKIVLFQVRYFTDWRCVELVTFVFLGIIGGLAGAGFIKASRFWATTFRRIKTIKAHPWLEVLIVALVTGCISFWNRYTNLPVAELLLELASPCGRGNHTGLCPENAGDIPRIIGYLSTAFVVKAFLTVVTFGIKVPAGIYVPSMVCGGLMGRIVGHVVQYAYLHSPDSWVFAECSGVDDPGQCITPGVYALVAAGATMCGVTRLSVTLAVILFELTGSLDHVLPFAIGVLVAKWTADYVEPSSIYDLLIEMNSYPFIDNQKSPIFDAETQLGDITPRYKAERVIDITISPYVRASELRLKLDLLHATGELDGGLPILREKALVGLIPAPDLEFALDGIEEPEGVTLCLMSHTDHFTHMCEHKRHFPAPDEDEDLVVEHIESCSSSVHQQEEMNEHSTFEVDFVRYVDPAPVTLEVRSPLHLVYECFTKLGLRYICVAEAGAYRGMVHKKRFVKYLKTMESKED